MILRGLADTNSIKITRRTVQRMSVNVRLSQVTLGTIATPNFQAVNLKCELRRNGASHIIFHENLATLAFESMYFHGSECVNNASNSYQINPGQNMFPLMVDLGAPINLQGDDELVFEASTQSAWLNTATAVAADSTIEFEWRDHIGVERSIPFIKTKVIQATTSKVSESLGDNVTSIALISHSAGVILNESLRVFDNVMITSDRYNINDNLDRMISRRLSQFETMATAASRMNSWVYRPETEIDGVQVSLSLYAPNVVSSQNYIVYRTFLPDSYTIQRSLNLDEKHAHRNHAKFFKSRKNHAQEIQTA